MVGGIGTQFLTTICNSQTVKLDAKDEGATTQFIKRKCLALGKLFSNYLSRLSDWCLQQSPFLKQI